MIENRGGMVTLRPLPGGVCQLNGREIVEPCRLAQGQFFTQIPQFNTVIFDLALISVHQCFPTLYPQALYNGQSFTHLFTHLHTSRWALLCKALPASQEQLRVAHGHNDQLGWSEFEPPTFWSLDYSPEIQSIFILFSQKIMK